MENQRKIVFISYSWDGEIHKEWVLNLANDLTEKYGLQVLLDQYDLTVGKNMTAFMEKSLEAADKVLIILTQSYKTKAENRKGGAGFEHSIISQELYNLQDDNNKFLPVLRSGTNQTSAPGYIKTLIHRSMVNDNQYESDLFKLAKDIYEIPQATRPKPGPVPNFDEIAEIDPIVERSNKIYREQQVENERLIFLRSQQAKNNADYEVEKLFNEIEAKSKKYQSTTKFRFILERKYQKAILHNGERYSVKFTWRTKYQNSVEESIFFVEYYDGSPSLEPGVFYFPGDEPKRIMVEQYSFDVDNNLIPLWSRTDNENHLRSEDISKMSFLWLLEKIEESVKASIEERRKRGY